jgi:serine/threonine-protein kinase
VGLAARSGSYRYRGRRDLDVRDVGRALSVSYVVQGTVRQAGPQLRVSAQLTDAHSGVELWSKTFDGTSAAIFRTQDALADAVTGALTSRVRSSAPMVPPAPGNADRARGTTNAEAYDLYLRAEYLLVHRQVDKAADAFRQAIARDPAFARAYAGLSQSLVLMTYFNNTPVAQIAAQIEQAAATALATDSTLSEAWMSRGMLYTVQWRWDDARPQFERAIAANPNDVQAHFQFGRFLFYLDEDVAAEAEWRRAEALDPYSALAAAWLSKLLSLQGRNAESLAQARRALEFDSTSAVVQQVASDALALAGDPGRARAMAERMPRNAPWIGMTAHMRAAMGDRAGAQDLIRQMEGWTPRPWFTDPALAFAYLGLGDTTRALDALERATAAHEIWPAYNRISDRIFDPVRTSARWAALVRRVGLDRVKGALPAP